MFPVWLCEPKIVSCIVVSGYHIVSVWQEVHSLYIYTHLGVSHAGYSEWWRQEWFYTGFQEDISILSHSIRVTWTYVAGVGLRGPRYRELWCTVESWLAKCLKQCPFPQQHMCFPFLHILTSPVYGPPWKCDGSGGSWSEMYFNVHFPDH